MKHSPLYKFMEKHIWMQIFVVAFPVLMMSVYIFTYSFDISNILYVLDTNDKYVEQDLASGNLLEVDSYTDNGDGTYSCKVSGEDKITVDTTSGSTVYMVTLLNKDTSIIYTDNNMMYVDNVFVYDSCEETEQGYIIKYLNHEVKVESANDIVYEVVINDYDDYTVDFVDETEIKAESIPNITVAYKEDKNFTLDIQASYNTEFKNFVINFATKLPSNNIYYNMQQGNFVQNLSDDFAKAYLMNSNFIIVGCSMAGLCFLLLILSKTTEWKILGDIRPFIIDTSIIGLSLLGLVLMTFMIL